MLFNGNGGHITPPLHHDYAELKHKYGPEAAKKIIRFRLAHLEEFLAVAENEGVLEDSEVRRVETVDVHFDLKQWEAAKSKVEEYKRDMPTESAEMKIWDGAEAAKVCLVFRS